MISAEKLRHGGIINKGSEEGKEKGEEGKAKVNDERRENGEGGRSKGD